MRIVVLSGGLSSERQVSLVTGSSVCRALRSLGHEALVVDMYLGLEAVDDLSAEERNCPELLFQRCDSLQQKYTLREQAPDLEAVKRSRRERKGGLFGPGVLQICSAADLVFLALHGQCGEDGRVQAAFDLLEIPYTGAGYLACGMAMDKAVTKKIMAHAGVLTPAWREVEYTREDIPRLAEQLPVPAAVKVPNGGSSLGVALADTREELAAALEEMLLWGSRVVVEEKIRGRELSVGVLGEDYLPAVEIRPRRGAYFDYAAKYQPGGSEEICPAPITEAQQREMGEAALALHRALGLCVYSRTDFILDETGRAWCLEINTLPGLTPASLLPREAAAAGIGYEQLCQRIVDLSLAQRRL